MQVIDNNSLLRKASTLAERLNNNHHAPHTTDDIRIDRRMLEERVQRWQRLAAGGDPATFRKRLLWEGISEDQLDATLGSETSSSGPETDWLNVHDELCAFLSLEYARSGSHAIPDEKEEIISELAPHSLPFIHLVWPIAAFASKQLEKHVELKSESRNTDADLSFTPEAYVGFQLELLSRLLKVSAHILFDEFKAFRPYGFNVLPLLRDELDKHELAQNLDFELTDTYYTAFVTNHLSDGWQSLFEKYPAMARAVSTCIQYWIESTTEFIVRIRKDIAEIGSVFFQGDKNPASINETLRIVSLSPGLGDYHNKGRAVLSLTFSNGVRLLYKPRELDMDVAFNTFLEWYNSQTDSHPFKIVNVLNKGDYGWVEYIEQAPCRSETEEDAFFFRTGRLLGLFYLLGTTDCHNENFIAHRDHLVLVDTETLLHHDVISFVRTVYSDADLEASGFLEKSVLRSGLLPQWYFDQARNLVFDISPIADPNEAQRSTRIPHWQAVNTDFMHSGFKEMTQEFLPCTPRNESHFLDATLFTDRIIDGFSDMYQFLLSRKEELLDANGPLRFFENKKARFIFRPTSVYAALLENSFTTNPMRSGIDRSLEFEPLAQGFLQVEEKPIVWPVLKAETCALEHLDIPYFWTNTSDTSLYSGDLPLQIDGFLKSRSLDEVFGRIKNLNENDLEQQSNLIRFAMEASRVKDPAAVAVTESDNNRNRTDVPRFEPEDFLEEALAIADKVIDTSFRAQDGSMAWIGMNLIPNKERYQFNILKENLYDGHSGIAYFLAACYKATGKNVYKEYALSALNRLRSYIGDREKCAALLKTANLGAGIGSGSMIYAMSRISSFLDEPHLMEEALQLSAAVDPSKVLGPVQNDFLVGLAGELLAFLKLYEFTRDRAVLDRCITFGNMLLDQQIDMPVGGKAWQSPLGPVLTGFSHGAAGITYALVRLYEVTGISSFYEAAREGIAFETATYSEQLKNWPDFRFRKNAEDPVSYKNTWCHGAPGICLSRIATSHVIDSDIIRHQVRSGMETALGGPGTGLDHICCGHFGKLALYLSDNPDSNSRKRYESGLQLASSLISRAREEKNYELMAGSRRIFLPGLFQGASGIGYQLLRLSDPTLPELLLLE